VNDIRSNENPAMTFDEARVIRVLSYHIAEKLMHNTSTELTLHLKDLLNNTAYSALGNQGVKWITDLLSKTWRYTNTAGESHQLEFFQIATECHLVGNGHSLQIQFSQAAIPVLLALIQDGTLTPGDE